ncbi:cytochrome c biogenesis CcdA family protein [Desulfospira joergensenii]|uniref:cytochrome c biogenesis CcdA family protein n=1 Tax=Desulfospira joergensenii TaxID=53329 RepID=UPI00040CCF5D|nr:cytochrome c biogenesis protein CcdA [Desulfospira joergensenii]
MTESLFLTINQWMTGETGFAAMGCFFWGMVSVLFSPCHLASIPLIIGYVGGQEKMVRPGQAGGYSILFTSGLFLTIAFIGILCAWLGRMMGDVGSYWQVLIGIILIWVALGMLGIEKCSISGSLLYRLNLRGRAGAFVLGLAYGVLSGSCTFGFIAPILAIITVQEKVAVGVLYIFLFALGHCLPIVVAGSSTAVVKKLLENSTWNGAGVWFRKISGTAIGALGIYFILIPFLKV